MIKKERYYFDWAASAPPDSSPSISNCWGNPSSQHCEGHIAKQVLEEARCRCAVVLNVSPETLYFTSGGTESNCIALYSNLFNKADVRVIAPETEHVSIRDNLTNLKKLGKLTGKIPVDSSGRVTPQLLANSLDKYKDVRFAAIMSVNNETGAITNMPALRDILRSLSGPRVHLHCDMVQAVGKIPIDISLLDIDSASISAHKIGGPRGIGLLYLRRPIETIYRGGGQERSQRPGTENVLGALALAACLEKRAGEALNDDYEHAVRRWKRLINALKNMDRCAFIPENRDENTFSPYILQAAFRGIPGEVMTRALDDLGFAVSTGSACSSSKTERPVLAAMGIDKDISLESIRISQGWTTTEEEIDLLIAAIAEVLKFL